MHLHLQTFASKCKNKSSKKSRFIGLLTIFVSFDKHLPWTKPPHADTISIQVVILEKLLVQLQSQRMTTYFSLMKKLQITHITRFEIHLPIHFLMTKIYLAKPIFRLFTTNMKVRKDGITTESFSSNSHPSRHWIIVIVFLWGICLYSKIIFSFELYYSNGMQYMHYI